MLQRRSDWVGVGLCALISLPAYVLGHRLRDGDPSVGMLAAMVLLVVLLSGAIMKQVSSRS